MTIHTVNLPDDTLATLRTAKPVDVDTLPLEAAIIDAWAIRWECATPAERQTMIEDLRITLGDKQHG